MIGLYFLSCSLDNSTKNIARYVYVTLDFDCFFFAFPIKTFSENNSLEINCLAFLSLFF